MYKKKRDKSYRCQLYVPQKIVPGNVFFGSQNAKKLITVGDWRGGGGFPMPSLYRPGFSKIPK